MSTATRIDTLDLPARTRIVLRELSGRIGRLNAAKVVTLKRQTIGVWVSPEFGFRNSDIIDRLESLWVRGFSVTFEEPKRFSPKAPSSCVAWWYESDL